MREDARLMRWGSYLIFAFAAMLMLIGLGEGEPEAFFMARSRRRAGALLWRKANSAREERREKLLVALQQPVLRLAAQRNGVLTVTDVAAALSWPMPRAEKVLNSLEDGLRVASTRDGRGRDRLRVPRADARAADERGRDGHAAQPRRRAPPGAARRAAASAERHPARLSR